MHQPVDRALQRVGKVGRYQKLFVVYLFFIAGFVNYLLMGPTYIYMNPVFSCNFSEDIVDESIACDRITECVISNDYTLVAHLSLYCDQQSERNLIQAINPIGSIFGLYIINFLSDYKGKKFAFIIAQFTAIASIVFSVIGGYVESVAVLVIAQFFGGFAGYSMIIMAYIYPSEFSSQQFRQKTVIIINYAWSLTSVLLGILSFCSVQWYNYLILYVLIPMVGILILSFFFLVEGPNFLYSIGKEKECLQSIKTIAIYNNTYAQYLQCQHNFKYESAEEKPENISICQNLKEVFAERFYKKMIFILTVCQMGAGLYYVATNFALFQIGYDFRTNMTATGVIELFSFLFLQFNLTKINRRKGMIALYGTMAILGMLFFIKPIEHSNLAAFILIGVLRFFGTIAYALVILLLTQVFPSKVQAICAGIIESITQLGNFLAPIIITVCINLQIYPVIVLSFVLMVTIVIPLWFMQQKKDETLKQSLIENDVDRAIQESTNSKQS